VGFKVEVPRLPDLEDRDRFGQVEEVFVRIVKVDGDSVFQDIIGFVAREDKVMVFDVELVKLIACALFGLGGLLVVGDDMNLGFVIERVSQQHKELRTVSDAVVQINSDFKHKLLPPDYLQLFQKNLTMSIYLPYLQNSGRFFFQTLEND